MGAAIDQAEDQSRPDRRDILIAGALISASVLGDPQDFNRWMWLDSWS